MCLTQTIRVFILPIPEKADFLSMSIDFSMKSCNISLIFVLRKRIFLVKLLCLTMICPKKSYPLDLYRISDHTRLTKLYVRNIYCKLLSLICLFCRIYKKFLFLIALTLCKLGFSFSSYTGIMQIRFLTGLLKEKIKQIKVFLNGQNLQKSEARSIGHVFGTCKISLATFCQSSLPLSAWCTITGYTYLSKPETFCCRFV